jgi:hypothetical protein
MKSGCMVLVEKPEGKRILGESRSKWENIRMNLKSNRIRIIRFGIGTSDGIL